MLCTLLKRLYVEPADLFVAAVLRCFVAAAASSRIVYGGRNSQERRRGSTLLPRRRLAVALRPIGGGTESTCRLPPILSVVAAQPPTKLDLELLKRRHVTSRPSVHSITTI